MFDVLHNVFGKKKPVETGTPADDSSFVLIEKVVKGEDADGDPTKTPALNLKNPYAGLLGDTTVPSSNRNATESNSMNTLTVQDVPFKLNSALNAAAVMEQLWKSIAPCLSSISKPHSLQLEYDFSLERSVMAEN